MNKQETKLKECKDFFPEYRKKRIAETQATFDKLEEMLVTALEELKVADEQKRDDYRSLGWEDFKQIYGARAWGVHIAINRVKKEFATLREIMTPEEVQP